MDNAFAFIFEFFEKILALCENLKNFLFEEVNIFGETISVWGLLSGGIVVTILVAVLIKAII